jgi:Tetratricopeptide repeat
VGRVEYQRRPEVASHPVRLAPRPAFLAGREELLTGLDARLSGGDGPGPRMVVLSGLGGAGKTSVALEYAHRHLAEVAVAWQFAAEDPAVLAAGFGELAAQLGARDLLDARDPVASVHGVLAALGAGWLLVFDNAPDRASVQAFLPPAGRGGVLVTSRDPFWPPGQVLEVQVLDREVAAGFLGNRTGDADRQAALELADELGGLPLALEQAAAYIQATGNTLAGYLDSFRRRRPEMLARGEPAGYGSTVAATWSLAFGRLEQSAPGAAGLLRLLACCAPEAVPLRLLLQPREGLADRRGLEVAPVLVPLLEDQLAAGDAIAALRRYSLVSRPADGVVSVHRLVHAVMLDQMPAELASAWRQAAADLIEAAIPGDPLQPGTWPLYALLLPHVQAALAADSDGMADMADYLGYSGSYAAARDLCQSVVEARVRASGAEHPATLTARSSLALWTGMAGDAASARDQFAALLPIRERVLGPEDPDTLADRGNLADWTGATGDAAGARDQYAALLPVFERVSGPEHPNTLTTRANLARFTGEAGDAAGARDQFAALLPVRERVSGPEHPDTLTIRASLAFWAGEAGDAAGARDQFAALLPVRERVLGPEHPETLNTRANLAYWSRQVGNAEPGVK